MSLRIKPFSFRFNMPKNMLKKRLRSKYLATFTMAEFTKLHQTLANSSYFYVSLNHSHIKAGRFVWFKKAFVKCDEEKNIIILTYKCKVGKFNIISISAD